MEAFEERAQCIARQYSKYYVLDGEGNKVYVNGNVSDATKSNPGRPMKSVG